MEFKKGHISCYFSSPVFACFIDYNFSKKAFYCYDLGNYFFFSGEMVTNKCYETDCRGI